jgi:photosystem II stability/assembly factor-like uncharacterized protein
MSKKQARKDGTSKRSASRARRPKSEVKAKAKAKRTSAVAVGRLKAAAASPGAGGGALAPAPDGGPRQWFLPLMESAYSKLVPRGQAVPAPASATVKRALAAAAAEPAGGGGAFLSQFRPGLGQEVLATPDDELWMKRLEQFRRRTTSVVRATRRALAAAAPGAPAIPGQKNWAPLGPSVVSNGQAQGLPSIGGRVSGIAVVPGGLVVYAASANGGVFRSDDGGMSWTALMDAFNVAPTDFASTSLACGAIAIDPRDPRRVYVGTGEGDTNSMFSRRVTNALPAYRGIGPIRSDNGGKNWERESTAAGSPTLGGKAFFALAVDPTDRENVLGATTDGLYQRVPKSGGDFEWVQRRDGIHPSVKATSSGGTRRFVAAQWGGGVFQSPDGQAWSPLGTGFPTTDVGRIALGVQPNNTDLVYALVANTRGALLGVYRLDGAGGAWKKIANPPDVLPVDGGGGSQGDYDLAIAVDPSDPDLIYLGGSYFADQQFWPASVWRCRVKAVASGYRMTGDSIGVNAHADVHVLVHTPDNPEELWVGCDGGIFVNRAARSSSNFASRNNGLACLCPNFFAQHPTDPNVLFCGLQDNGTARTRGGPIWKHVNWGDGGYCLINWADPQQVLVFANGTVYRATDGGEDHNSWAATADAQSFGWAMMTEPIVGTPYNLSKRAEADLVALGVGPIVYLSQDFGATWRTRVPLPTSGGVFCLTFASAKRLFAGTTAGEVFRLDRGSRSWSVTRIDDASPAPLGLQGLISDIAIDWSDTTLTSVYVTFGGIGDYRHVWHFNGTGWAAASGPPGSGANNLLDVEHNALVVDPKSPGHLYAGADIGVWHSPDRGQNWFPMANGLPEAPVFDLQVHPTRRLLRASTHGRGLYEYPLDPAP